MRLKKIQNIALIAMVFFGLVLSFTPVSASYNISVEADGIALQGARDSIYAIKIKNIGAEKIESAEVFITEIGGRPVTSDGDFRVANNPQTISFLGEKGERLVFPISVKKDVEPGIKDVKIKVIIGDESIEKTGILEIEENTSSTIITDENPISVTVTRRATPNESMLLNVVVENPKTNAYDISNVSVELVGIATNPDYSDVREIPTHNADEFAEYDFFSYPSNLPNVTKLEGKVIAPGKSNKDVEIVVAASSELAIGTYYPVFNVTFQTPEGLNTIEVKDPATINIEIVKVPWYKAPFRWFLDMLKNTVGFGSYGIAIIILGILLKVVLIPLTNVQFKSMKQNAEVQPLIKKLNEKYPGKENAQKRQEETMKIYKEHNVNLFAGCLPLLVQMPIIIALYTAISNYAPFSFSSFLWMPSLGAPDPFWVMAILMGLSTWFQQRVSQMPGQESNMAMQVIFPLFLAYIAFSFPAALTLYWVTFSLVSIGHQMFFNKQAFGSYILKANKPAPGVVDSK